MRYTKQMRRAHFYERLINHFGLTWQDADDLRKAQKKLRRWHELECGVEGGGVERDETTGKVTWYSSRTGKRTPYPDRETGCLKRIAAIVAKYPELAYYVQGDPRGCALYLYRKADLGMRRESDSNLTIGALYSSIGFAMVI
jgi:hypothetical protein